VRVSRVLVTGGRGTIGAPLCAELRRRGHAVLAVGRRRDEREWSFHEGGPSDADYARADVANHRQLARVFEDLGPFDLTYHLAAEFGRWNGEYFYENLWRTNVVGTKNVLDLVAEHGGRLVQISSSEVYGDWSGDGMAEGVMDAHPVRQLNDYAISKWVNELQVRNAVLSTCGLPVVVVRPFNIYGPGERYSPYRSVNCRFLYSALCGREWTIYRGHRRTSLYVDDAVRTLAALADKGRFRAGATYNLASTEDHTIERLSDLVLKVTGADPELAHVEDPEPMTMLSKRPVVTRAVADLDHRCEVGLEEGLGRTWEWMKGEYRRG
jgi:dTDP-glucose 4,6-dehydratase